MDFPGGSDGRISTCNVEDLGLFPGLGRSPGGGHGNPLQYSCHGQRSLTSYSLWGHKELDLTDRLSTTQHISKHHKNQNIEQLVLSDSLQTHGL